eukprot:4148704-Prymnesium_polylepis.1
MKSLPSCAARPSGVYWGSPSPSPARAPACARMVPSAREILSTRWWLISAIHRCSASAKMPAGCTSSCGEPSSSRITRLRSSSPDT